MQTQTIATKIIMVYTHYESDKDYDLIGVYENETDLRDDLQDDFMSEGRLNELLKHKVTTVCGCDEGDYDIILKEVTV